MQQGICLERLHRSLDGIPGVPAYDAVPVHTFSAAQLCLNAAYASSMDLIHSRCASPNARGHAIENVNNIVYMSTSLLRQVLVDYYVRHFFCFIQSPYFLSICTAYDNLFLSLMLMHCISLEDPYVLSYLAALCVSRNMFLKHDFLARVASFFATPRCPLPNLFLVIKMLSSLPYAYQLTSAQCSSSYYVSGDSQRSAPPNVDSSHSRCVSYGGGRPHIFTLEEIGNHIIGVMVPLVTTRCMTSLSVLLTTLMIAQVELHTLQTRTLSTRMSRCLACFLTYLSKWVSKLLSYTIST
jgi:hypothetical protein